MNSSSEKPCKFYSYIVQWSETGQCFTAGCWEFPYLFATAFTEESAITLIKKMITDECQKMQNSSADVPAVVPLHRIFDKKTIYEQAAKAARIGLWEWNIQTDEIYFDETWYSMLGYFQGDVSPCIESWKNLIHPDDRNLVFTILNDHLEGKTEFYETTHRILNRSGQFQWILNFGRIIDRNSVNTPIRVIGFHIDRTRETEKSIQSTLLINELKEKIINIREFSKLLPICSVCKKIRLDSGSWQTIEKFFSNRFKVQFSHGLCKECAKHQYPSIYEESLTSKNTTILQLDPNSFLINYAKSNMVLSDALCKHGILEKTDLKYVVLNLKGVEYIDSSGISNIILLNEMLRKNNKYLEIRNAFSEIIKVFRIVQLARLLKKPDETEEQFYKNCSENITLS